MIDNRLMEEAIKAEKETTIIETAEVEDVIKVYVIRITKEAVVVNGNNNTKEDLVTAAEKAADIEMSIEDD